MDPTKHPFLHQLYYSLASWIFSVLSVLAFPLYMIADIMVYPGKQFRRKFESEMVDEILKQSGLISGARDLSTPTDKLN